MFWCLSRWLNNFDRSIQTYYHSCVKKFFFCLLMRLKLMRKCRRTETKTKKWIKIMIEKEEWKMQKRELFERITWFGWNDTWKYRKSFDQFSLANTSFYRQQHSECHWPIKSLHSATCQLTTLIYWIKLLNQSQYKKNKKTPLTTTEGDKTKENSLLWYTRLFPFPLYSLLLYYYISFLKSYQFLSKFYQFLKSYFLTQCLIFLRLLI